VILKDGLRDEFAKEQFGEYEVAEEEVDEPAALT